MSTCPENDIHSVYLDGELPAEFIPEYEAHVASCSSCQKLQNELKSLQSLFAADNQSMRFSRERLDQSFERLQARLSYSKYVNSTSGNRKKRINYTAIKYFASGMAAALVVALILPVKNKTVVTPELNTERKLADFAPVSRNNIVPPVNQVSYGNGVEPMHLNPILKKESQRGQGITVGSFDQQNSEPLSGPRPLLYSYDVFTPPAQEAVPAEKSNGFSFQISSPFVNISLKFGN